MRLAPSLLAALALSSSACVNTDAAVFVEAHLGSPSVTVSSILLGTTVKGQVSLSLHLGARASGDSAVSLGAFSIVSADQTKTLMPSLPVKPNVTFPVTVHTDSDASALLTFDSGSVPLAKELAPALCAGGPIRISGILQDSLQTAQTPVVTDPFTPTCM
jgi:hypothetical protein